jgi:hypothetical protein
MSELTIDDAVAAALSATRGEVVLRDRTGKEIGRFRATIDQAAMHAKYGHLWTEEDLKRAEEAEKEYKEKGGYTHAEVMAYLRNLDAK